MAMANQPLNEIPTLLSGSHIQPPVFIANGGEMTVFAERPAVRRKRHYLRSRVIMLLARLLRIEIDVRNSYYDCPPCRPATPSSHP